jgi:hypothetical protein
VAELDPLGPLRLEDVANELDTITLKKIRSVCRTFRRIANGLRIDWYHSSWRRSKDDRLISCRPTPSRRLFELFLQDKDLAQYLARRREPWHLDGPDLATLCRHAPDFTRVTTRLFIYLWSSSENCVFPPPSSTPPSRHTNRIGWVGYLCKPPSAEITPRESPRIKRAYERAGGQAVQPERADGQVLQMRSEIR